ncbi:GTPase [Chromohalobacter sp. 48-RD10]|uniref:GTPase family protein n=1 Tax=Chromohalobacter sp. 48-RD10 TaxID=2994063 RepID=UPI0024692F98|nr:GTPase [Chromohalobacter sp. 48-RD10]
MTHDPLSELSSEELRKIRDRIRATKINVLLVGGTGVGKSSTISALFQSQELESNATVGQTPNPETIDVSAHELNNLIIWDTPGLGDSPERDKEHRDKIIELLHRKDEHGQPLIDLVFLILDAGNRDFSSAFALTKDVILPNLAHDDRDRLLIGLNQADQAMKGYYWNKEEDKPEPKLLERLDELHQSVKDRIKGDTGLEVDPIYYSAGCILNGEVLSRPYNLQKLLSFILERLPKKKRAAIALNINEDEQNFQSNDDKEDYQEKAEESILSSLADYIKDIATGVGDQVKKIITNPDNIKWAATKTAVIISAMLKNRK